MISFRSRIRAGLLLSVITAAFLLVVFASKTYADTARVNNLNKHDYASNSAAPSYSYMVSTSDGGYMIFEGAKSGNDYLVEYYDPNLNLKSTKTIAAELPIFGCFYSDGSYYYVLTGHLNNDQSSDVECYRLTKYNSSWTRLSSCGLYDCNTTTPFRAGSASITSSGDYLVVRTCHQMYKSSDGLYHQANLSFMVNTSTMTILDSQHVVFNESTGYCSHSFNQFVKFDGNHIIGADHGDAYPRAIAISYYKTDITTGKFTTSGVTMYKPLKFSGKTGNNMTGATMGGLEISGSSYIVAGSSMDQSDSATSSVRNIYIGTVSRTDGSVSLKWLTNYGADDTSAGNPFLVKINDNKLAVIWSKGYTVYYAFIDGKGNLIGSIYSAPGYLSDCQPIYAGGAILWYAYDGTSDNFFRIEPSSGIFNVKKPLSISNAAVASISAQTYNGKVIKPSPDVTFGDIKLVKGTDYTLSYENNIDAGTATVTIRGKGKFTGTKSINFKINPKSIASSAADQIPAQKYTGYSVYPAVTVKDGDRTLQKSVDYYTSFSNNKAVGKATVTINGKGNYKGSITADFYILKAFSWYQEGGNWLYFKTDGYMAIGWHQSGSSWYYFGSDGFMSTGWIDIEGKWYNFGSDGVMLTGWQEINKKWYYFEPDGSMVTGWRMSGNNWYCFGESGAMITGWLQSGGKWYYFGDDGAMVTSWQQIKGKWYYFEPGGAMVTGWRQSSGKWYYFDPSSGVMITGWKQISGKWYYFESSGAMKTGWHKSGDSWYYFEPGGAMVTGSRTINGKTYNFNSSGVCTNP